MIRVILCIIMKLSEREIYILLDYLKKLTKIKYNKTFLKLLGVNTKIL